VPLNATVCGDPAALSVIVKLPDRLPAAAGVNVTVAVQLPPAATPLPKPLPQVVVLLKSPELLPVIATEPIVNAAFPVLLSVTVWLALAAPIVWLPNARLDADNVTAGARPAAPAAVKENPIHHAIDTGRARYLHPYVAFNHPRRISPIRERRECFTIQRGPARGVNNGNRFGSPVRIPIA
jgi:hypothetical protein